MAKVTFLSPVLHVHGKISKHFQCRLLNGMDILQSNPDRSQHVNTPNEAANKQSLKDASQLASRLKRDRHPLYLAAMAEYDARDHTSCPITTTRWNYWVSVIKNMQKDRLT